MAFLSIIRRWHKRDQVPIREISRRLGYEGSYNRVAAFARAWKEECKLLQQTAGRGTFVPLSFAVLCARRSISVRLERGFCGHWRHPRQAAGGAYQAVPQPRLSAADA